MKQNIIYTKKSYVTYVKEGKKPPIVPKHDYTAYSSVGLA